MNGSRRKPVPGSSSHPSLPITSTWANGLGKSKLTQNGAVVWWGKRITPVTVVSVACPSRTSGNPKTSVGSWPRMPRAMLLA